MDGFVMPQFDAPFPLECNRHLTEASGAMWDWIEAMGLATTSSAQARMRRTGADLSGAYVWPRADLHLLTRGLKWLALTFRIDDQLDEDDGAGDARTRQEVVTGLASIVCDRAEPTAGPVPTALATLWAETSTGTPNSWRTAFASDFTAFLQSYADDANLTAHGILPSLDDYLPRRVYSVGMPWLWDLDEQRLPVYLPESVRSCRLFQELRTTASLHIALVNDVVSMPREQLTAYPHNAVLIIQRERQYSLQEAVDHVAALVSRQVTAFNRARRALPSELDRQGLDQAVTSSVLEYVSNLAANMRGQLAWHLAVGRYATDDLDNTRPDRNYPPDLLPS